MVSFRGKLTVEPKPMLKGKSPKSLGAIAEKSKIGQTQKELTSFEQFSRVQMVYLSFITVTE